MASRKEYMREWRKANPNYYKSGTSKRHCKECNIEVGKGKSYCSECYTIRKRARAREHYTYTPEKREYARRWREANPDRIEEYKKRKRTKRYCKECNGNVDKYKLYCSVCLSVRQEEQKKRHNLKQTEYRKQRYENRDRLAYNAYFRNYFRKNKEKVLYIQKKFQERQKQGWYKSRLERIEKLKLCLEEKK